MMSLDSAEQLKDSAHRAVQDAINHARAVVAELVIAQRRAAQCKNADQRDELERRAEELEEEWEAALDLMLDAQNASIKATNAWAEEFKASTTSK